MRRTWALALILTAATMVLPTIAFADTATGGANLSWSALTPPPGDWSALMVTNLFPISGTGGISATQTTVVSNMVGQVTSFVAALAMFFLCYSIIMQIHRGAETSRVLGQNMTGMFFVRLGMAAILMFPIPGIGFSTGQMLVVKTSLWGVGLASTVYANVVKSLGPEAMTIANPVIPGVQTIVRGLMENELCRDLANVTSRTITPPDGGSQMVPQPSFMIVGSGAQQRLVLPYKMSAGNNLLATPVCGSVSLSNPSQGATVAGVSIDQTQAQIDVMGAVLTTDIRPSLQNVAINFNNSKDPSSLAPLMSILTQSTADYTARLQAKSVTAMSALRASVGTGNASALARRNAANQAQLTALGWTGAAAYFLEFAQLNGATSSLMAGVPVVLRPTYAGFPSHLASDLAPMIQASRSYLDLLDEMVQTQDPLHQVGSSGGLFTGATAGSSGSGVIEGMLRSLGLGDTFLSMFQGFVSPTAANWSDPFSGLMSLGNWMVSIAVTMLGLGAVASSGLATGVAATFNLATGDPAAAAAIAALHLGYDFLATPIFFLALSLLVPGLTIAYVIPMTPWVMWMAGVMGWLILVCEAVIAVPLWMLAHMTMSGDGLHGHAKEGYSLLFNVLMRPTLMLVGLFLAYYIYSAMAVLINQTFSIAAGFVISHNGLVSNVLGVIVLISMFVLAQIVAVTTSFRMISLVPHHLPKLIGFSSGNRVDVDEFTRNAAAFGIAGTMGTIQQAGSLGMKAVADRRAKRLAAPDGGGGEGNGGGGGGGGGGSTSSASRLLLGSGMDSTLAAGTDTTPPRSEEG